MVTAIRRVIEKARSPIVCTDLISHLHVCMYVCMYVDRYGLRNSYVGMMIADSSVSEKAHSPIVCTDLAATNNHR